jgi:hypothetical protein
LQPLLDAEHTALDIVQALPAPLLLLPLALPPLPPLLPLLPLLELA